MTYLKYLWSYLVHKFYFSLYGLKYGVSLDLLFTHDLSKLLPSEFVPYARFFYGKYGDTLGDYVIKRGKRNKDFNKAWNLHQKRNKHHWQYWVLIQDDSGDMCIEIPMRYRKEMVVDWMAANKAFGDGKVWEWYWDNVNITLETKTQDWVEDFMDMLEDKSNDLPFA
ncbi:MAG: hypothetical protein KQI81_08910 [Deltaproteobacteria bacterium]|nr:hypothetical protein [Deltaproteobacteria bacterium]